MLKFFFEIGSDPALFRCLVIEKERDVCGEYQGKFSVVSISLKEVEGENYDVSLDKSNENVRIILTDYSLSDRYGEIYDASLQVCFQETRLG